MPNFSITADFNSAGAIRCAHCWDHNATCIELSRNHEHDPDEHVVVCAHCAYLAGLKQYKGGAKVIVEAGSCSFEMIPIFAPSTCEQLTG
jgi:hypothetical protein